MTAAVTFTVLPRSNWTHGPAVSIYVRLSLEQSAGCQHVRDSEILERWPDFAKRLAFDAYLSEGGRSRRLGEIMLTAPPAPAHTLDLWKAMMPGSLSASVEPGHKAFAAARIQIYDFAALSDAVDFVYARKGKPRGFATGDNPLEGIGWWGTNELQGGAVRIASASKFRGFAEYHLPDTRRHALVQPGEDCDERLSKIQSYPPLMRAFGLVLDGEINLAPGAALPKSGSLAVQMRGNPFRGHDVHVSHLWSAYETMSADGERFAAVAPSPKDTTRRSGLYLLDQPGTRMVQYPLDNSVNNLMKAAVRQAQTSSGSRQTSSGVISEPPAMQSVGFSLYHPQVAQDVQKVGSKATVLHSKTRGLPSGAPLARSTTVYADDVDRGLRIDVYWSETDRWHSLGQRTLRVADELGAKINLDALGPTEAFSTIALSSSADGSQKCSQRLFGWLGWSINLPRPDNPTNDAGDPVPASSTDGNLWIAEEVLPDSLPKLRFGDSYAFRCRLADICGNGLTINQADKIAAKVKMAEVPAQKFVRYDPLGSPIIVANGSEADGTTVLLMTVHGSDGGPARASRYVHPPRTTPPLLEFHGSLDDLSDEDSHALFMLAAAREGGPQSMTIADFKAYVGDPLAKGASFVLDDGLKKTSIGRLNFAGGLLRMVDDGIEIELLAGPLQSSASGRQVSISLPRGKSCLLRIASACDPSKLHLLAFGDRQGEPTTPFPDRNILLIHPTPTPLQVPAFGAPAIDRREFRSTHINFHDPKLSLDVPTTGRVTIEAAWTERCDAPDASGWSEQERSVTIAAQDIELPPTDPMAFAASLKASNAAMGLDNGAPSDINSTGLFGVDPAPSTNYDFKDTFGRVIAVRPVAQTRHLEFFPATSETKASPVKPAIGASVQIKVPATLNPPAPTVAFILPTFLRSRQDLPHRVVEQSTEGWGLRLFLNRDWREEWRLAVVFDRSESVPPAYSAMAADPLIRSSVKGARLEVDDILAPAVRELRMPARDGYDPSTATPGLFDVVDVAHSAVGFDAERNLRFADVVIRPQPGLYKPFIRLALARYCENSIPGAELSRCAFADWAQPAANRAVSLVHDAHGHYRVTVVADAADGDARSTRSRFFAHVEHTEYHDSDEYGWDEVAGSLVELRVSSWAPPTWAADLPMRGATLIGRRRVVVREVLDLGAGSGRPGGTVAHRLMSFDVVPL